MLSSVANRVYWAGRYLERTENTARLLNVYSNLLLDLPADAGVSWHQLVRILGCEAEFAAHRRWPIERSAVKFVSSSAENFSSIANSIAMARFNIRALRDVMPKEAFEAVNEMYLFADRRLARTASRRQRFDVLTEVVERCQQLTGLFAGTMNHGEANQFLRLGRNLERADMTTRIIDVAGELLQEDADRAEYLTTLWVNVLRSLSAYQAYRQSARSRISSVRVLYFVLNDPFFPRSVAHCLGELRSCALTLPMNETMVRAVDDVSAKLAGFNVRDLARDRLHDQMDALQQDLAELHGVVQDLWLSPHQKAG
jgi:uncharacterized alpha-E superfamily protein